MLKTDGNTLILSLADILTGNKVEGEAILKALGLMCNGFSFDCGMVYDVNFMEQFCLMEHYETCEIALREKFEGNELTKKEWVRLAQKPMLHMEKSARNTVLETKMLEMYAVESLILAPVADENGTIYGMVALLNAKRKATLSRSDEKILSVLLSMLVRYTRIRMYQRKLDQAQKSLKSILDNTGIDIYVNDFYNHDILYVN
ncbi:MAG: hypothetical protein VB081_03965, partial [Christensenella sp.]|nr:hypothetical protein [Christensenella sp.]